MSKGVGGKWETVLSPQLRCELKTSIKTGYSLKISNHYVLRGYGLTGEGVPEHTTWATWSDVLKNTSEMNADPGDSPRHVGRRGKRSEIGRQTAQAA